MATSDMADDMIDPDFVLPAIYTFTPIRALRITSRKKIAQFLNLDGTLIVCNDMDLVTNWNGLAELAGFQYLDIRNMMRKDSPTEELLDQWTIRENDSEGATIGNLWRFMFMMERFDVLKDCRRTILNDCRLWDLNQEIARDAQQFQIEQDPTVSNSEMKVDETRFACRDDVEDPERKKTYFDAFICYTSEDEDDRKFVREMIEELEKKRNLKLFIPGRDDLPGSAEHTITAYLIEVRCRRVVILMSKSFLTSQACDFQVKFAHALAPGARSKKLIPVIREKKTPMPRILKFLAVCDFTKSDMKDWVWDRLSSAIKAPIGPVTYFEEEDTSDPFDLKSFKFPKQPLWLAEGNANAMSAHGNAMLTQRIAMSTRGNRMSSQANPMSARRKVPASSPNSFTRAGSLNRYDHTVLYSRNNEDISTIGGARQPTTHCEREPVESSYRSTSFNSQDSKIKPNIPPKPKSYVKELQSPTKNNSFVVGSPTIDSTTTTPSGDVGANGGVTWI